MHVRRVLGLVACVCALTGALVALHPPRVSAEEGASTGASLDRGRSIWLRDCAVCHSADASGSEKAPDLRHVGTAMVDFMVTTGRMPLRGTDDDATRRRAPRYSPADIDALVAYSGTLVTGPEVPDVDVSRADVSNGSRMYTAECAACHQAAGGGGALAWGATAPPLHDATAVQVVEAMRTGPGTMPIFDRSTVSATDARDIAGYVQELRHPRDRGGLDLGHLGPVPEGLVAWLVGLGSLLVVTRLLGTRVRPREG